MYSIFNNTKNILIRLRLFLYIIISIIIIFFDIKLNIFFKIQNYIHYPTVFLHVLNSISHQWLKTISYSLKHNQTLILKNHFLEKELFIKNSELLLMKYYQQENDKLRELLSSPVFCYEKTILSQIIFTKINSYTTQITIDKGIDHNVHIGQAAINNQGVIGQVIQTNKLTSQILLICDISHALPVQILRNNIRMILQGNGYKKSLQLKNFPNNSDIKIGDILITSGLGGRFPVGYPVATISSITINNKTGYTNIQATPIVDLNNLSYILLLKNITKKTETTVSVDPIYQISNKNNLIK